MAALPWPVRLPLGVNPVRLVPNIPATIILYPLGIGGPLGQAATAFINVDSAANPA